MPRPEEDPTTKPTLKVSNPDELIAAIPHLIGYQIDEALVVLASAQPGAPNACIGLPTRPGEQLQMEAAILNAYRRHPGAEVLLIAFSDERERAEVASAGVARELGEAGLKIRERLWAGEDVWVQLDTGNTGPRSARTQSIIDAHVVHDGHRMPAASRVSLKQSLHGDPESVRRVLPTVIEHAAASTRAVERQWSLARAERFADDRRPLSDPDAARMMLAAAEGGHQAALSYQIGQDTAESLSSLWNDLTRRAPDELVAGPAVLAALAGWMRGNGALAWCALDRIPAEQRDSPLAQIVSLAQESALPPRVWDDFRDETLAKDPSQVMSGSRSGRRSPPADSFRSETPPGQTPPR
ncbi:hypothetical protein JCM18899A_46330 [Nocardioides sp. AN3]